MAREINDQPVFLLVTSHFTYFPFTLPSNYIKLNEILPRESNQSRKKKNTMPNQLNMLFKAIVSYINMLLRKMRQAQLCFDISPFKVTV